jgi:two-component system, OmpR family, sensor histidine kinase TctE
MTNSLRVRLLLWLLLPLALYVLFAGKSAYDNAKRTADLVQDNTLVASARMIAGEVEWVDSALHIDFPPAALEIFASPYQDQVFYSITVDGGRLLAGTPDFPRMDGHAQAVWYDASFRGNAVRAVSFTRMMYDAGVTHRVLVSIGKTEASRDAMIGDLWRPQLLRQIAMVALAVFLVCIGLTIELRPLLKVREEVADRDPMQLEPIRVDRLHTELRPIVDAINQCIARLGLQAARQRRFIAAASHQLRTPLTLLDTQLQYARRRERLDPAIGEALGAMHKSSRAMVTLTNKLLLLAQAEAADYTQLGDQRVDLNAVAMDVIEELALLAQTRHIDLGADLGGDAHVVGNAGLLVALVTNLTDNAIRYTQPGGRVTVSVHAAPGRAGQGASVQLTVADNGPGIPAEARSRVFEPFYRAAPDTDGTGLGLAIVHEIVDAHRGAIVLGAGPNGKGVLVSVTFAQAPTAATVIAAAPS